VQERQEQVADEVPGDDVVADPPELVGAGSVLGGDEPADALEQQGPVEDEADRP
jgi:hypothetical protein